MPKLDWIGKKAVVNHHREVPFHLLKNNDNLSVGDSGSGNLLVQGDNLIALKALLPYYAGQVKCIYIDPPYNTGNENWIYNDNVNSPEMQEWLGKTVGKEGETLDRHDRWLCMMYPRLALLREFLRGDGAIFISIDDNEVHLLRMLMDDIFGNRNFVTTIIWQKIFTVKNSARHFSEMHDYILVYAKNIDVWHRNLLPRSKELNETYSNPDNDSRGPWTTNAIQARNYYSQGSYEIISPAGKSFYPPSGTYWRISRDTFDNLNKDGRVWWGKNGNSTPRIKKFLSEVKQGVVPATIWFHNDAGQNAEAKAEVRKLLSESDDMFITPKPTKLIEQILQVSTDKDSLVLDSFAGSGTTGHAILAQNATDGGNRRFILVEMDDHICRNITAQRLTRVSQGYNDIPALGGGFRFCELGEPLFDERGNIRPTVSFADLARHVYFTETGEPWKIPPSPPLQRGEEHGDLPLPKEGTLEECPIPKDGTQYRLFPSDEKADNGPSLVEGNVGEFTVELSPLLGIHNGTAIYLLYNGILKDKSPRGGNVLTTNTLAALPGHDGPKVIYGAACRLDDERMRREGIVFKQLPYKLKVGGV